MHSKSLRAMLPLAAVAATFSNAAVAQAEQAPSQSGEVLETVTVTAQKREEKLQDVPIAITAFSKTQLQNRGIENIADLSALAPGLQVSKSPANDSISQISIRGNAEINPAIYWDPAVGIYLDGVYLGKSQGTVFDVVELNRVEVLRGPQGTLYGRNTIGGAINLVTRAPSGQWSGELSTELGNYGQFANKISADLPAFGIAKLSVAARSEQRDGWVKTTPGSSVDELNDRDNLGLRVAADIAFTPDFLAALRYDRSAIGQNGTFSQLYRIEPSGAFDPAAPAGGLYGPLSSFASQERQKKASIDSPSQQDVIVRGQSMTLSWNLDPRNTVKAITAYRTLENNDAGDYDGSPLAIAETARLTMFQQFSQELQWVGKTDRLSYVGGLYYYNDHGDTNNPQSYFFGGAVYDSRYGTRTEAKAVYGQLDYKPIEPVTLTAGLRYTTEQKTLDRLFGVAGSPAGPFTYFIPEGTTAEKTFDATTPTLSAAYKFSDNLNTYVRYAEGFKSGGFNGEYSNTSQSPAQNVAETQTPFKPEKQKSYELGVKSTYLSGRAQLNASVFHNQFTNLQQSLFVASGAAASVVRNAGKGTIEGVELEGVLQPIKGTRLQANYAYLRPEFDRFIDDAGVDQADNRAFTHAPKHTFNVVIDSRLLTTSFGTLRAIADYAYTAGYYLYPYQLAGSGAGFDANQPVAGDTRVKSYGLLNLRLALSQIPLGRALTGEVALVGRNVTDEKIAANFIDFGPGFGHLTNAYYIDPVTYGLTATIRW